MTNHPSRKTRPRGHNSPSPVLLSALILGTMLFLSAESKAETGSPIPLYSWWSASNKDHLCTSDPRWAGTAGQQRGGYRFYRREGYIYPPNAPQPPNTVAVYRWWSASRKDHYTTTKSEWKGEPGKSQFGYEFERLEGYILASSGGGRLPLTGYYSKTRKDNVATAAPASEYNTSGYRLARIEGYLLASPARNNEVVPATLNPDSPLARRRAEEAASCIRFVSDFVSNTRLKGREIARDIVIMAERSCDNGDIDQARRILLDAPAPEVPDKSDPPPPAPRIISFELTPTTVEGYGGDWIEISWKTEGATRVRLYEEGNEIVGRFELSNGEIGLPLSLEHGFKTQYERSSHFKIVATNSHGQASETKVADRVNGRDCRVIVEITGPHAQFTDGVGVLQIEPGRPDKFLFKSPVSTVRDHRKNKEPAPFKRSSLTLPPGDYVVVPTGGGTGDRGQFGVIYRPGNSKFACRDGNSGRLFFTSLGTEY